MAKADSPTKTCGEDGCDRPLRARGLCSTHYNQRHQPDRHKPRHVTCSVCGKPMVSHTGNRYRKVCSDYCRWFYQRPVLSCPIPETHPAHHRWAGRLLPVPWVAPEPQQSIRRWVAGNCHRCGTAYVVRDYADLARFCSLRCAKRVSRQRYRARKKDAYVADVSPARIYGRDGWRCRLCGRKVRKDKVVPHPLAPVLDHIVPLAAGAENGGVHAPHNVQCAHFICNSRKRDLEPDVQLMLFG